MDGVRPQSETVRAGLIPHRWPRLDDPDSIAIVAAYDAIIAGGGPAGLTAAYELTKHGSPCVGLEADPRCFVEAMMVAGEHDGAAGWVLGVVGVHNWHIGLYADSVQEEVWGEEASDSKDSALKAALHRLNTKLSEAGVPLEARRKRGYVSLQ